MLTTWKHPTYKINASNTGTSNVPNHLHAPSNSAVPTHSHTQTTSPMENTNWLDINVCLWNAHSLVLYKLTNLHVKLYPLVWFLNYWDQAVNIYDNEILPLLFSIYRHDRKLEVEVFQWQLTTSRIINIPDEVEALTV